MIVFTRINKNHLFLKTLHVPDAPCPLCKGRGEMEMSFYQLQLEAGWVRNTKKVTASVSCKHCNQEVPVVRWNAELDAFYKAEKKLIPAKTSFKTGKVGRFLIWLNILFFGTVLLLLAGIFIYHRVVPAQADKGGKQQVQQSSQYAANPQPGDLVLVFLFEGHQQALFKVIAANASGDSIQLIRSGKSINVVANAKEVPSSDGDFKPGNESRFSLKEFSSLRLTTTSNVRLGNIQMVYRK